LRAERCALRQRWATDGRKYPDPLGDARQEPPHNRPIPDKRQKKLKGVGQQQAVVVGTCVVMMPILMRRQIAVIAKNTELRENRGLIHQRRRRCGHAPKRQPQEEGDHDQRPEDHQLCRAVHAHVHKRGILYRPPFDQTDLTRNNSLSYHRPCWTSRHVLPSIWSSF
jgi:hypothetical protein